MKNVAAAKAVWLTLETVPRMQRIGFSIDEVSRFVAVGRMHPDFQTETSSGRRVFEKFLMV